MTISTPKPGFTKEEGGHPGVAQLDAQDRAPSDTSYALGDHWELRGNEDLGDPAQNAARARLAAGEGVPAQYVRGFVVVGRAPQDNTHTAVIEHSFSMDVSKDRANIWLHRAKGDFGGTAEHSAKHYAESFSRTRAPMVFRAYDLDDPECPIGLDWVAYEKIVMNAQKAGRRVDKFDGRNRAFYEREVMAPLGASTKADSGTNTDPPLSRAEGRPL